MDEFDHDPYRDDPDLSPETNEVIRLVHGQLRAARDEVLRQVKVTPDMPERMMLAVLEARLGESREAADDLVRKIREAGGPDENRLHRYLYDVLYCWLTRRIDGRIRDALLFIDQGIKPGTVPRKRAFHPGTWTPYKRRLVVRDVLEQAAIDGGEQFRLDDGM